MTRANFIRERRKHGRIANLGPARTCAKCRGWVEFVTIREQPKWQYLIFNKGQNGELHHCPPEVLYAD